MSRVILHIGTHKTATTTIQDTFAHNAGLLAQYGVVYPKLGKASGHHGLVSDWVSLPKIYNLPGGSLENFRRLAEKYANTDKTIFLSSEEFSRGRDATRPDFTAIRDVLAGFDQISVICTLREQWQFIQSIYLEVSKTRQPKRPPEFLEAVLAEDMVEGLWTDYNLLYDHLLKSFSSQEITFLNFDTCRKQPGGIIGAMLRYLNLPLDAAELESVNNGQSNTSPQPVPAWAANIVAAPEVAPTWLIDAVTGAFEIQFGRGQQNCLWTGDEFETLLEYSAERNNRLTERHRPIQRDFDLTDPTSDRTTKIFRDHLKADFWVRASRWIFVSARNRGVT